MSRSVLVVDDDVAFRRLARAVLTSWGHLVVGEAGTAGDALVLATDLHPDTVLADIGLPDGDGFTLAADLRGLTRPPRVILISSDCDLANGTAADRVGAHGFVPKYDLPGGLLRRLIEDD